MHVRVAVLSLAVLSIAAADTLTLRSGRVIQGTYLGGTSRQVRMEVGERIETFAVMEVESIRFDTGAASAPAEPARTPQLMRPEPAQPPRTPVPAVRAAAPGDIPAGTELTIRMIDDVDSENAQVGQTFRASVDDPVVVDGRTVIPRGADVVTRLVEVKDPNRLSGGGQLTLDLVSVAINGRPVEVQSQAVTQAGESRTGSSAKVIGGTAALGAIIGAIAGGGKGAAIGAVSGAGAGTAIQVLTNGPRVRVPSETRLTFTLQQPLRVPKA